MSYYGADRATLKAVDQNVLHSMLEPACGSSPLSSPTGGGGAHQPKPTKCESSVPGLAQVAKRFLSKQLPHFQKLKDDQIEFERAAMERAVKESAVSFARLKANLVNDLCLSVKNCSEFQSARVLLSSLGYCSALDSSPSSSSSKKEDSTVSSAASSAAGGGGLLMNEIVCLDNVSDQATVLEQITYLDTLPTRTFSSGYIFYVRKGQTSARAILENVNNSDCPLDDSFYLFIQSLGSIVSASNISMSSSSSSTR